MVEGVLIAESLRVGCQLADLDFAVTSLTRSEITQPASGQPPVWTFLAFRSAADPDQLAAQLSEALSAPGWYVDFRDEQRVWVVYPQGKVFSYGRDDTATGRRHASTAGRSASLTLSLTGATDHQSVRWWASRRAASTRATRQRLARSPGR